MPVRFARPAGPDCRSLERHLAHAAAIRSSTRFRRGHSVVPAFGARRRMILRARLSCDDTSRELVLAFKHADRTRFADAFGLWMLRTGARILDRADLIVPVPLHRRRLLRRRCNQPPLLARALTGYSGVPTVPDLLQRSRNTPCKVVCRARRDDGTFERLSRCGAATMNGSAARR